MKEEQEELDITFDPSRDEVLGVFGDEVHVRIHEGVLVMSRKLYLKTWKNWLEGKANHCERYNEYCGVGGYTVPTEVYKSNEKITLIDYIEVEGKDEEYDAVEVPTDVYVAFKFNKRHDFEHG